MNNDFNNGQPNDPQNNQQMPPINQTWNNQPAPDASSAQTQGIVALVLAVLGCNLIALIIGILAITKAGNIARTAGYMPPEARTGRICGIIAIVIAGLYIVLGIVMGVLTALGIVDTFNFVDIALTHFHRIV